MLFKFRINNAEKTWLFIGFDHTKSTNVLFRLKFNILIMIKEKKV